MKHKLKIDLKVGDLCRTIHPTTKSSVAVLNVKYDGKQHLDRTLQQGMIVLVMGRTHSSSDGEYDVTIDTLDGHADEFVIRHAFLKRV